MAAAARGEPYAISFGGRTELHYAADVARAFVRATRLSNASTEVFDMPGESIHMSDVVAAIEAAAPEQTSRSRTSGSHSPTSFRAVASMRR